MITATWADAVKAKYGFTYRSRCQALGDRRPHPVLVDERSDDVEHDGVDLVGDQRGTQHDVN
jgi:hypothetical protein